jgi:hypothetical protein
VQAALAPDFTAGHAGVDAHQPVDDAASGPHRNFREPLRVAAYFDLRDNRNRPDEPLRANIDETVLPVVITEQGENRNQCEEQRSLFGFSHGVARRGT